MTSLKLSDPNVHQNIRSNEKKFDHLIETSDIKLFSHMNNCYKSLNIDAEKFYNLYKSMGDSVVFGSG